MSLSPSIPYRAKGEHAASLVGKLTAWIFSEQEHMAIAAYT